jgi:CubicO group peptidase (beta-lactamase class C family)
MQTCFYTHNELTMRLIIFVVSLFAATSSAAQTPTLNFRAAADYSAANLGDAVVVMQRGQIVFEEYQRGFDGGNVHLLASGTKSFNCVLAVAAQDDGILSLDEPVANTITSWRVGGANPAPQTNWKSQITARQLLSLSGGLASQGDFGANLNQVDTYAQALYVTSTFAPGVAAIYTPNTFQAFAAFFELKTGGTLAANGSVTGGRDPLDYLSQKIFTPLGINASRWSRDTKGKPNMAGGAYLTARDWLKFGQLLLQDGKWNGRQLLNASRLRECSTYNNPTLTEYGISFWLNRPLAGTYNAGVDSVPQSDVFATGARYAEDASTDIYMAAGALNQRLYMIPSLDLVVARFGSGGPWSDNEFLKRLLGTVSVKAQPFNYQDLWWAGGQENGWGFTIGQQGDSQFNVFYVYDSVGKAQWVVMPGGTWNAAFSTFTGPLYIPTGSPFSAYDATRFNVGNSVGTATLNFRDASTATLNYTINGVAGSKTISRLVFGDGKPLNNYSDLWWGGGSQNGWGLSITQQGSTMFGVWYTYDAEGKVQWLFMPGGSFTSANIFSGALYRTTSSPWLGVPYNAALLNVSPVGDLTLTFSDANTANMRYSVDGVSGTNAITRLVFGSPAR